MNEKGYKKRLDFQQKMISRQSEQIEDLKLQIERQKSELEEKDEIINSVSHLRKELSQNVEESKKYKEKYEKLVDEVKLMKDTFNREIFNNRWWLVRILVKLIKFLMK